MRPGVAYYVVGGCMILLATVKLLGMWGIVRIKKIHEYAPTRPVHMTVLGTLVNLDDPNRRESYHDVVKNLYEPLGYSLRTEQDSDVPFPSLSLPRHSCDRVFTDWLLHNAMNATNHAPKWSDIGDFERQRFLMRGYGGYGFYYMGEDAKNSDRNTTNHLSPSMLDSFTGILERKQYSQISASYGIEGASMYHAMAAFRPGNSGMTVGTIEFWVEAIARFLGARSITIAEYQPISIHDSIKGIRAAHPVEIARNRSAFESLDWVGSFSSLEHSGLGRYGDILDPYGDLKEVHKIHCLLKPKGIFYLGLPTGSTDGVAWNAHRIYSKVRWPLMAAGFRVLGFYRWDKKEPVPFLTIISDPSLKALRSFHQVTAVLQKIPN